MWFPLLSAERLERASEAPADAPFALVEKVRGATRLAAVDARALALGIATGLTLADARAQVPELVAINHDPAADHLLLERIADGCDRYTPLVAIDPPDGLTLDVTGCAHLFDGEAALAEELVARLAAYGLQARHALADTPEAAQALARFQTMPAADEAGAIRRLGLAALRLDDATELALRRAGLKTIGDLAGRPTGPLAARFGDAMTGALARLLGRSDSRIVARCLPPALQVERRLAEPIAHTEQALMILGELAAEASAQLEQRHLGGRRFVARFFRSDGLAIDLAVDTSLPVRDPAVVMRLFDERLGSLADPIDPGFGFDLIRLAVPALAPLAPTQLLLEGGAVAQGELAALIDRLSTRMGRGRFRRMAPRDTHIPEQAVLALPAVEATAPASWPEPVPGEPPLRPLHLFDPPQPIQVTAQVPDGPPRQFRWRRTLHEVMRFEGPERIAAEWWHDTGAKPTRDYYRIEDAQGRRFWVFRHGLYETERPNPGWYMHGLFA